MNKDPITKLSHFFKQAYSSQSEFIELIELLKPYEKQLVSLLPFVQDQLKDWEADDCISSFPKIPYFSLAFATEWHPQLGEEEKNNDYPPTCHSLTLSDPSIVPQLDALLKEIDLPDAYRLVIDIPNFHQNTLKALSPIAKRITELEIHRFSMDELDLFALLSAFPSLSILKIRIETEAKRLRGDFIRWLGQRDASIELSLDLPSSWLNKSLLSLLADLSSLRKLKIWQAMYDDVQLSHIFSFDEILQWVQSPLFGKVEYLSLSVFGLSAEQNALLLQQEWNSQQLESLWINYDSEMNGDCFENLAQNDTIWKQARFDNKDHGSEELIEFLRFPPPQKQICWYNSEIREAIVSLGQSAHLANIEELFLYCMVIPRPMLRSLLSSPYLQAIRHLYINGLSYTEAEDWQGAIHLGNCRSLEAQGALDLLHVMLTAPHFASLAQLTLHHCPLRSKEEKAEPLLFRNIHHSSIQSLRLCYSKYFNDETPIDIRYLDFLLDGQALPRLHSFSLIEQRIQPEELVEWIDGFQGKSSPLQRLEIVDCPLDRRSIYSCFQFAAQQKLQHLSLSGVDIDNELIHTLLTRKLDLRALQSLDISHNPLKQRGGKAIAKILKQIPSLQDLNISHTHLSLPDFELIGQEIAKSGLQSLFIGGNYINDDKLKALLSSSCPALKNLGLSPKNPEYPQREQLSQKAFLHLASSGLWEQLNELQLNALLMDNESWKWLESAPPSSIKIFSIDLDSPEKCLRFSMLNCFPLLEHLYIGQIYWSNYLNFDRVMQCADDCDLTVIKNILFSGRFPHLQSISLSPELRYNVDCLRARVNWLSQKQHISPSI